MSSGFGGVEVESVAALLLQFAAKIEHGNLERGLSRAPRTCGAPALRPRTRRAPCRRRAPRAGSVSPAAAAVAFRQRSVPGVGASVTRSFGSTAFRSPANCSASRRGLIAKAIPAASPPQMARCVSGRFGRMKATASPRSTPRRRKRLPAWVMRRNSSRCDQTVASLNRLASAKKVSAGASGAIAAPARSMS